MFNLKISISLLERTHMMSASNDMCGGPAAKKEVAQRWMVWLLIDRSHRTHVKQSGTSKRKGKCSSSCSTDNNIVPEVITIEGELRSCIVFGLHVPYKFSYTTLRSGIQLKRL